MWTKTCCLCSPVAQNALIFSLFIRHTDDMDITTLICLFKSVPITKEVIESDVYFANKAATESRKCLQYFPQSVLKLPVTLTHQTNKKTLLASAAGLIVILRLAQVSGCVVLILRPVTDPILEFPFTWPPHTLWWTWQRLDSEEYRCRPPQQVSNLFLLPVTEKWKMFIIMFIIIIIVTHTNTTYSCSCITAT